MYDKVLHSTPPGTSIAFLTVFHVIPSTAQLLEPPLHVLLPSNVILSTAQLPEPPLHFLLPFSLSPLLQILCLALHPGSYLSLCSCCLSLLECHLRCLYHWLLHIFMVLVKGSFLPRPLLKSKLSPTLSSSSPSLLSCTFKDSCHSRGSLRAGGFYCSVPLGCPLK